VEEAGGTIMFPDDGSMREDASVNAEGSDSYLLNATLNPSDNYKTCGTMVPRLSVDSFIDARGLSHVDVIKIGTFISF
jgi:hypothetical protein